jgi:hypothetical protein
MGKQEMTSPLTKKRTELRGAPAHDLRTEKYDMRRGNLLLSGGVCIQLPFPLIVRRPAAEPRYSFS